MERHLRSRRARRRLDVAAALCAVLAACAPLAPLESPPAPSGATAEDPPAGEPAMPPDLPEPGDNAAHAAVEPAPGPATEEVSVPANGAAERAAVLAAAEPAQVEVRGVLEAFYEAYNARDWKRARTHFWDGATISDVRVLSDRPTPAVKVSSVAEFFDELARTRESGPQGFAGRLEGPPEVRTASNVAQAWCHFQASFDGPQESMTWRRVDAFTFVLLEGTWKIAALAQSRSIDVPEDR